VAVSQRGKAIGGLLDAGTRGLQGCSATSSSNRVERGAGRSRRRASASCRRAICPFLLVRYAGIYKRKPLRAVPYEPISGPRPTLFESRREQAYGKGPRARYAGRERVGAAARTTTSARSSWATCRSTGLLYQEGTSNPRLRRPAFGASSRSKKRHLFTSKRGRRRSRLTPPMPMRGDANGDGCQGKAAYVAKKHAAGPRADLRADNKSAGKTK